MAEGLPHVTSLGHVRPQEPIHGGVRWRCGLAKMDAGTEEGAARARQSAPADYLVTPVSDRASARDPGAGTGGAFARGVRLRGGQPR